MTIQDRKGEQECTGTYPVLYLYQGACSLADDSSMIHRMSTLRTQYNAALILLAIVTFGYIAVSSSQYGRQSATTGRLVLEQPTLDIRFVSLCVCTGE